MNQATHDQTIIELSNICFSYNRHQVLHGINLSIHKGDYLGIIGPNGGGKTTLIKIILGLLKPQSGSVKLFDTDISSFKSWSKIGYVPQKHVEFEVKFPATVFEVVAMGRFGHIGLFKGLGKTDIEYINQAIGQVEMGQYKQTLIANLSGGQQQRVFIARSLASQPEVLFLDEPTVGIDFKAQQDFYRLLKKLNSQLDITLVLVSHDLGIIASEVTEVACVNNSLVYHGLAGDLHKSKLLTDLYGEGIKLISHIHD